MKTRKPKQTETKPETAKPKRRIRFVKFVNATSPDHGYWIRES